MLTQLFALKHKAVAYSFTFEPVIADGMRFEVNVRRSDLKRGHARLENGAVIIEIPRVLNQRDSSEMANWLYQRIKRGMEKNLDRFLNEEMKFFDGQEFELLNEKFQVRVSKNSRVRSRAHAKLGKDNGVNYILISVPPNSDPQQQSQAVQRLVPAAMSKALSSKVENRILELNRLYFSSSINCVRVRASKGHWGVTSHDNVITISARLLCMPQEIVDYVLVHELAHTKIRSHSKKFWVLVENVLPDYKQRKNWLKENSNRQLRAFNQYGTVFYTESASRKDIE